MPDVAAYLGNEEAVESLAKLGLAGPRTGFILGSGWGHFVESCEVVSACPYEEIPGFGRSTVVGHAGRLVRGRCGGHDFLAMQGRLHHYEGYSLGHIGGTVAVLHGLGVRELVVTNAAGAINRAFRVGDLMLIHDFLNFMFASPLRGALGAVRSPVRVSERLIALCEQAAEESGIPLRKGVLAVWKGPTYETPSEVRMAANFGADAASMSTAPELIAAAGLGMEAVAFSCITNMAPGVVPGREVNHEEVIEVMQARRGRFSAMLGAVLEKLVAARS